MNTRVGLAIVFAVGLAMSLPAKAEEGVTVETDHVVRDHDRDRDKTIEVRRDRDPREKKVIIEKERHDGDRDKTVIIKKEHDND